MLGVVGEQAALACGGHVLGALGHVCSGGVVEDPLSHVLHAAVDFELAAGLGML